MNQIVLKISNNIKIDINTIPDEILEIITEDLTFDNPVYIKAQHAGKYTGKIEKFIRLYKVENKALILPRGYVLDLMALLKEFGQVPVINNQTLTLPGIDFGSKIKPRDYQEPAIQALVKGVQGGIISGCGSGKTEIMLEAMAKIGQPSLWVTHTIDLMEQLIDRACQNFDIKREEIGVIANGKVDVGNRLTVALIQTLNKTDISKIADRFGAIFIDEGHHMAADSFYRMIGQMPARYRLWCTATPDRGDGLSDIIFAIGGNILYVVNDDDLPTITPQLVVFETEYKSHNNYDDYSSVMGALINDNNRNSLIVDAIEQEALGHYSLVLSERIDHLYILQDMLTKRLPAMKIEILTGTDMTKKQRQDIINKAKAQQVDILLATHIAREGLDLPHLDRLFLVTPKKAAAAIKQEVGRIQRHCDGKLDAVVFDFWDKKHGIFNAQFWKRQSIYKDIGIDVDFKNCIWRIDRKNAC